MLKLEFDNWLSTMYLPVKENMNEPVDSALAEARKAYEKSLEEAIGQEVPEEEEGEEEE